MGWALSKTNPVRKGGDDDEVVQALGNATRPMSRTQRSDSRELADLPQVRKLRIPAGQQ
jgi:hypothetical protein